MQVKELIKKLEDMPYDSNVRIYINYGSGKNELNREAKNVHLEPASQPTESPAGSVVISNM